MKLKLLDLFSGIGGFSLGLERTGGFKTVAFCEIEPFPRAVLREHWPDVPIYDDVRTLNADVLRNDGIAVDVICGGFPCQDISNAGKRAGIEGERSGLWREYARLVGELRPRYVLVENVAALLGRGLGRVLGDLAEIGYDAEWHCIPACVIGAPHRRDRLWIVAYRNGDGESVGSINAKALCASDMADAISRGQPQPWASGNASHTTPIIQRETVDAFHGCVAGIWTTEPDVGRVANGVPARLDRLKGLGNAVVPQIPEMIGNAMLNNENFS